MTVELSSTDATGAGPVHPLAVARDLPSANRSVVPARRVVVPAWLEVTVSLIVVGLLTSLI